MVVLQTQYFLPSCPYDVDVNITPGKPLPVHQSSLKTYTTLLDTTMYSVILLYYYKRKAISKQKLFLIVRNNITVLSVHACLVFYI